MDDVRVALTPEVQALLHQLDQTLLSIPAEHCERIVRELLAELHHKIAHIYQMPPTLSHPDSASVLRLRALRQELHNLQLQHARLGVGAPRDLATRIGQIMEEIRALDSPVQ
jgi:hypothetical protein